MRKLLALGSLVLLAACGSKSNSGPSPVPTPTPALVAVPTTLSVVDGLSGQPVSGAPVVVGSNAYTTDGSGQVTLPLKKGDALTIQANGFLPRLTKFRDPSMTLWDISYTSAEYINALVHNEFVPGHRLSRPNFGMVQVVPSAEILADADAMRVIRASVQEVTNSTGGRIVYSLDQASSAKVNLYIDPIKTGEAIAGLTFNNFSSNTVMGADVYFQKIEYVRMNILLHELGHTLGLGHSIDSNDIMSIQRGDYQRLNFSDGEYRTIKMMMLRLPGTAAPDNDQAVTTSSFGESTVKIVD